MSRDRQLQKAVIAELSWDPQVDAAHIGVAAHDGIVTLTGHVETYSEIHQAEAVAARVRGCKGIAQHLEVRLSQSGIREDEEIAAAIVHRLAWTTIVSKGVITPSVKDGWVTLTGEVDWHFQKEVLDQDLRRMMGVTGVTDLVAIKPRIDVRSVADDVRTALHRSWFFDEDTVAVSAEGGTVRLSGSVSSLHDRRAAERAAWAAPGTANVENLIAVV